MQDQKNADERREPSPRLKYDDNEGPSSQAPPPSEPFFDSGIREEKAPRSEEEHGGAADAGSERWAQPGTKDGPPPSLAKPTGTATGAPSPAPTESFASDEGDG